MTTPPEAEQWRRSFRRHLIHATALDPALVNALWSDPGGLVASGHMLKDGDRSAVVRVDRGDRSFTLKAYALKDWFHTVVHGLMRSRAAWSRYNAMLVRDAGILTPAPRACLENRLGPLRGRSYFLCDHVAGANLDDLAKQDRLDDGRLAAVARQVRDIWTALGRARLCHGDLKATNFLVADSGEVWLLDLDGMRRPATPVLWRRQRDQDRRRFMKNWQDLPRYEAAFRACVDTA